MWHFMYMVLSLSQWPIISQKLSSITILTFQSLSLLPGYYSLAILAWLVDIGIHIISSLLVTLSRTFVEQLNISIWLHINGLPVRNQTGPLWSFTFSIAFFLFFPFCISREASVLLAILLSRLLLTLSYMESISYTCYTNHHLYAIHGYHFVHERVNKPK